MRPRRCPKGDIARRRSRALHQAEGGEKVADICCEQGISEATFYLWRKMYGGAALSELREMCQLRDGNAQLERLVADLLLDGHGL